MRNITLIVHIAYMTCRMKSVVISFTFIENKQRNSNHIIRNHDRSSAQATSFYSLQTELWKTALINILIRLWLEVVIRWSNILYEIYIKEFQILTFLHMVKSLMHLHISLLDRIKKNDASWRILQWNEQNNFLALIIL